MVERDRLRSLLPEWRKLLADTDRLLELIQEGELDAYSAVAVAHMHGQSDMLRRILEDVDAAS